MQSTADLLKTTRGNTPLDAMPADYLPPNAAAQWLCLQQGPDAGKRLFFYDVTYGEGEPEAVILFVHGNPESSYTYRQCMDAVIAQRSKTVRIVALDHIGFGFSDQASYEMVDFHHAANLQQLVSYLDLRNITLVIHDWGGAIGVGALLQTPERVAALVVMNTTVFPLPTDGMNYTNFPFAGVLAWNRLGHWVPARWWRYIPPLVMFSPASTGAFARHSLLFFARALLGRLTEKESLYRDMFATRANALSSMRNVKQTSRWGHGYRYFDEALGWQDNHAFYQHIQATIGPAWGNKIPVRSFWGLYDPCAREEVRAQWQAVLPQIAEHMQLYPKRGHFVEEHEYADIAQGILQAAAIDT